MLLEEMPLELQLIFKILLLLDLPQVQVLLDDQVDVRRRFSLSNCDPGVWAVVLVKVRLVLVFCLDLSLQEVVLQLLSEVNPISLYQNLKLESIETLEVMDLVELKVLILRAARLGRNAVVDIVLLVHVVVGR